MSAARKLSIASEPAAGPALLKAERSVRGGRWFKAKECYGAMLAWGFRDERHVREFLAAQGAEYADKLGEGRNAPLIVHQDLPLPDLRGYSVKWTLGRLIEAGGPPELCAGKPLPAGYERWDQRQRDHWDRSLEWERAFLAVCAELGKGASKEQQWAAFGASEAGMWARRHGLPVTRKNGEALLKVLDPDGPCYGQLRRRGGARRNQCDERAWNVFKGFYLAPEQRTVAYCHELTAAAARKEGWSWPGLRAIQLRVAEELPPPIADLHRRGERRWTSDYAPRIERDTTGWRPGEVWVADHRPFDLMADGPDGTFARPYVTRFTDLRSRRTMGFHIDWTGNTATAMAALRQGVERFGAPRMIILDNGRDFRSKAFSGGKRDRAAMERAVSLLGRLGIEVSFAKPYNAAAKPVERCFRVDSERFDRDPRFAGRYCGRSTDTKPQDMAKRLAAAAPLSLDEVREAYARYIEVMDERPHRGDGMNGRSPRWVWEHCDPIAKRTAPADVLQELLRECVESTVTKGGVRVKGVGYGQDDTTLFKLIGSRVWCFLDAERADRVDVYDAKEPHRFITTAYNRRLTGLTPESIREGQRRQAKVRKLAKAALPAVSERWKTTADFAIEAQAEAAELAARKAAGGENDPPPPKRNLALLKGAGAARKALQEKQARGAPTLEIPDMGRVDDDWDIPCVPAPAELDDDDWWDIPCGRAPLEIPDLSQVELNPDAGAPRSDWSWMRSGDGEGAA